MLLQSETQWVVRPRATDVAGRLADTLDIHPVLAAILAARGYDTPPAARSFLKSSLDDLYDPFDLPDMEPAVERIIAALESSEPVLVHGDYDADGITAAALLVRFLAKLGADVTYYLPHRFKDSYGLSETAIRASKGSIGLIITVDCGVRDHEVVAMAYEQDQDVIVVDHHEPGDALPARALVIDPKRDDSTYPERELAAVGLAFKLATAVCMRLGMPVKSLQRAFLDLVAVGTIADVAPLVGENRVMASAGLRLLPDTRKPGLQVLMELAQVKAPVRVRDVAFGIGPRLNAAGRMGDPIEALELMITTDEMEARRRALQLEGMNAERRREQETTFAEAMRMVDEDVDVLRDRVIVLAREDWHRGVIGIVASKVLEQTGLPVVMLAVEGEWARGSARSVEGFNIAGALDRCGDLLERYGGHALAAGLDVRVERLSSLRERLNEVAREMMPDIRPARRLIVDSEVELGEVDERLARELALMEPCGEGNPEPTLCARGMRVLEVRQVGGDRQHLKLLVEGGGRRFDCIGFGMGNVAAGLRTGQDLDVVFTPIINNYSGSPRVELRLADLKQAGS